MSTNKIERVVSVAERIERIGEQADRVAAKLDHALAATERELELADGTADAFLSISAKLRGVLGAGTNFPPTEH